MIINADILEWAASYDGPLFHALLCDPPYHLTEIVKRFGKPGSAPAQLGTDGAFQRSSRGFMGRSWDGGDLAFQSETWAALANLLHPGAFLMAFAGSRGYHRMACAIEDAGLIIHPAIGWSFGSGFPKATRIDTQVDRRAGAERETVGIRRHQPKFDVAGHGAGKNTGYNSRDRESFDVTAPATELAAAWQGHRYGLQAMKPAFEFICVAQKPYQGQPVDCITRTGTGALWIDGGRIDASEGRPHITPNHRPGFADVGVSGGSRSTGETTLGRWPANLILQHSPLCNGACAPDCPVRRLGEQSGESESKRSIRAKAGAHIGLLQGTNSWQFQEDNEGGFDDQGTAARFFFQVDYMYERMEAADPLFYCAKADRAEREAGLDPRQIALLGMEEVDQQIRRKPADWGRRIGGSGEVDRRNFAESTINDGRQKSIDNPYQRGETTRRNTHPCQKPLSLTRYLATLLLPPAMYAPRRLLVPFSGAASEYIGALLAGWDEIVGVEMEADYCRIAEARATYWMQRRHEFLDPSKPIAVKLDAAPDGQLDMFMDQPAYVPLDEWLAQTAAYGGTVEEWQRMYGEEAP